MPSVEDITGALRTYILKEFFRGAAPSELTESTPLITGGILDSMAMAKLITFLEESYGIAIEVQELDFDRLNNVSNIAAFVHSKL
jgi:acyl carrier protein